MNQFDAVSPEDERAIATSMKALASAPAVDDYQYLDADAIWRKAILIRRWQAERAAQRPLDWIETIYLAGGSVAAALIALWWLPLMDRLLMLARL
jgi:hypothetical protein